MLTLKRGSSKAMTLGCSLLVWVSVGAGGCTTASPNRFSPARTDGPSSGEIPKRSFKEASGSVQTSSAKIRPIPLLKNAAASPSVGISFREQQKYTLEISVGKEFFASPAALQYLDLVNTYLTPRTAVVEVGGNLRSLIAREYAIGVQYPVLRDRLVTEILKLNKIPDEAAVLPGEIAIPNFPANPSPRDDKFRPIPIACEDINVRAFQGHGAVCAVYSVSRMRELKSANPPASQSIISRQRLDVPMEFAKAITDARIFSLSPSITGRFLDGNATLTLDDQVAGNFGFPEAMRLSCESASELAFNSKRRLTTLIVHDSGWPTKEDRDHAYLFFYSVFDDLWRSMGVAKSPYIRTLPSQFDEARYGHCKQIAEALQCYTHSQSGVQVLYLPLSREQQAVPLLRELLHIYYLLPIVTPNWAGVCPKPTRSEIARALSKADGVLAQIPLQINSKTIDTNQACVSAPLQVLAAYALRKMDFYYVMNYSWTVPHRTLEFPFPDPLSGVIVTAAGNESMNVVKAAPLVEFASRCVDHNDTICVANYELGKGKRPGTSYIEVDSFVTGDDLTRYVSFDGNIQSSTGTSFAAPRVAWLVAAAESVRAQPISMKKSWGPWLNMLMRSSKKNSGADSNFLMPEQIITNAKKIHE